MSKHPIVPVAYLKASEKLGELWSQAEVLELSIKRLVGEMLTSLESSGYTRTAAINKIADDHKHLKGFSTRNVKYNIPDEMKDAAKVERAKSGARLHQKESGIKLIPEIKAEIVEEKPQIDLEEMKATIGTAIKTALPNHIETEKLTVKMNVRKFLGDLYKINRAGVETWALLTIENGEVVRIAEMPKIKAVAL